MFDESHARDRAAGSRDGLVDGLRVDHPDGLADPGGYLDALRPRTGGAYVLVEKILEGDERCPPTGPATGTTGYDALADIDRVLVDPSGQRRSTRSTRGCAAAADVDAWAELDPRRPSARSPTGSCGPRCAVDRSSPTAPTADGRRRRRRRASPSCSPASRCTARTCRSARAPRRGRRAPRRPRTGPTSPRRSTPLVPRARRPGASGRRALPADVGHGDGQGRRGHRVLPVQPARLAHRGRRRPGRVLRSTSAEFHRRQQRRQAEPAALDDDAVDARHQARRGRPRPDSTCSPRSPSEWASDARAACAQLAPLGDGPFEKLLWQAIVGAWPRRRERLARLRREGGPRGGHVDVVDRPGRRRSSDALHALVDAVFDDAAVSRRARRPSSTGSRRPGWSNSLSAKLIQLTAPGVPDVYQGSELWETSLVDPDNRRPVDFARAPRAARRARRRAGCRPIDATGAAKLLVTSGRCGCAATDPELFTRYLPRRRRTAGRRPRRRLRPRRRRHGRHPPAGRPRSERGGWGDTTIELAGRTAGSTCSPAARSQADRSRWPTCSSVPGRLAQPRMSPDSTHVELRDA